MHTFGHSFPGTRLNRLAGGLIIVALTIGCGAGPVTPTGAGVPWDLAELRAETLSDIRYDFSLKIPANLDEAVSGSVRVSFAWADPLKHDVVLDFLHPESRVQGVTVNGAPIPPEPVNDHVVISASALVPGANEVEVIFEAGDEALNRNEEFLYTLFVPERARFSLPVFDQPNLKARFSLTLEVPDGWTAIANGPLLDEPAATEQPAEGGRILRFGETCPLPSYLFAFTAGRFEAEERERDGRTVRMFHREPDADKLARNRDALFDLHFSALEWLESYTAIDYPFQKFDFVLVPAFQYGGMEHAGAIFYRDRRLLLDESATQNDHLGRASLIAHETAHMWFGDLVTMAWFDDVWMKEVFANFMAAKIVHPSFPEVNHDLRFLLAHHPRAYGIDRTAGANPIRQPLENLNEAGSLYGAIIYNKAPVMMQQLELALGEELFRDGMREYLAEYSYGNATWTDLVEILDRKLPEDLTRWSAVWVDQPGRPTISARVTASEDRIASVEIVQEDPAGTERLWPQAISVILGHGGSATHRSVHLSGSSSLVEGVADLPRPDWVLPDGSGQGYAYFRLDESSRNSLMDHLPAISDATVRGAGWLTLWDAVLEREMAPGPFLDLCLRGLALEEDEQNLQLIMAQLGTVFWRFLSAEEREQRAHQVEQALWQGMENAEATTLKGAFFQAFRNVALSPDGLHRLEQVWSEQLDVPGLVLSDDDRTAVAFELAVREVDGWQAILDRQAEHIENPDRKQRFDFIRPALNGDPGVREAFFESLVDVDNRAHEPWVLSALRYLHHPLRAAHAEQFLTPSMELLEEIQRTGDIFFPKGWIDASLGGHSSPEAAAAVREFLTAHPDYPHRLRGKILQSSDMLFRAAEIASSQ